MSIEEESVSHSDFLERPNTMKWILRIFYGLCVLLALLDFIIHRHIETGVEKLPAFYAIYGFVACVLLVLMATQLRKWIMRDEHYYDKEAVLSVTRESGDD